MGILVQEAERCLDMVLFVDECPRWESGRLHHPYLLQRMFTQTESTGQKEYDCRIWQGCQQPMPQLNTGMEAPDIDLVSYRTTWEEIITLYHKVYQLKGPPGQYKVTQRPQMKSTKKSLPYWRIISSIGEVLPTWRNRNEDWLACQGWTHGHISKRECRQPMTIFRVGSRSCTKRPWE